MAGEQSKNRLCKGDFPGPEDAVQEGSSVHTRNNHECI